MEIINVNELIQKIEKGEAKIKEIDASNLTPGEKQQLKYYHQSKNERYNESLGKLIKENNAILNFPEHEPTEVKAKVFEFYNEDGDFGFMIQSDNAINAYQLAENQFGPQVNDMTCKQRT